MNLNELMHRRSFMNRVSIIGSAVIGLVVSVPIVAYLLTPFLDRRPRQWQDLGPLSGFAIGETVKVDLQDPSPLPWAGQTASTSAWVRRADSGMIAFSVHCTHLGCPVNWVAGGEIFLCPCHGGVFNAEGEPVGGPPSYPLQRHDVRVTNGRVEIRPVPLKFG
jgi:menaquinol-cytochrome c reductase iron-sulfur subunit